MAEFAVEFDFIEDDSGSGRFVAAGGSGFQAVANLAARGDVEAASRLYEDTAHAQRDQLLAEAQVSSTATRRGLIEVLKRARDFSAAAELAETLSAWEEAASLHEQASQLPRAVVCWEKAHNPQRAASAAERAGDLKAALERYHQAGDKASVARLLARGGRHLDAAGLYRSLNNAHAELEVLLAVPQGHDQRRAAVLRACELLDEAGHPKRALALMGQELRQNEKARTDFAFHTELARLLRRCGREADAQKVLAQLGAQGGAPTAPVAAAAPKADDGTQDSPDEGYAQLKAMPLFAELALADMKDLYRAARRVVAPGGVVLIQKGAQDGGLYVILEGEVEVYSGPGEEGRLLNTLGPGAWLGEISLVQQGPASALVRTKTPVRALLVSRENFHAFLDTHEAAALRIWRMFSKTLAGRVRALSA